MVVTQQTDKARQDIIRHPPLLRQVNSACRVDCDQADGHGVNILLTENA